MAKVEIYHDNPLSIDLIEHTFKLAFNIPFDKEYWYWRFHNNPNSKKVYISYIVEDGVLAAYYAVSPMRILIDGQEQKVALSNMTMTHPKYQGKGYFKKIAKSLYENLKKDNYIAIYGFANHNSHYGFRKYLNWVDLSILSLFQVNPKIFRNINVIKNNSILQIENITEEILNQISNLEVTRENNIYIKRDRDNIKWRLKNNPINTYKVQVGRSNGKIISLLFFKTYKKDIDIIEFFYCGNSNKVELMIHSISELIRITNSNINLWSNLYTNEHLSLEKQGFQETSFNTYFGVIPLIKNDLLLHYKNWHYRFIDSDIF